MSFVLYCSTIFKYVEYKWNYSKTSTEQNLPLLFVWNCETKSTHLTCILLWQSPLYSFLPSYISSIIIQATGWTTSVRFLVGQGFFRLTCEVHPSFETEGSGILFWGMKLTTCPHQMARLRMCEAVPPVPHMPAWCGAKLSTRDSFTFTFPCSCVIFVSHVLKGILLLFLCIIS